MRWQSWRSLEILVLNRGRVDAKLCLMSVVQLLQSLQLGLLLTQPDSFFSDSSHFHLVLQRRRIFHNATLLVDFLALTAFLLAKALLLANLQLKHVAQLRARLGIVHFDLSDDLAERLANVVHLGRHVLRVDAEVG